MAAQNRLNATERLSSFHPSMMRQNAIHSVVGRDILLPGMVLT